MPLRKPTDETHDGDKDGQSAPQLFPPEAYAYDSDVTDEVTKRIQAEADKILKQDKSTRNRWGHQAVSPLGQLPTVRLRYCRVLVSGK